MMMATTKTKRDGSEQVLLGKLILKEKPARKRDRRIDWKFSLETLRLREIEAVIRHRHGNGIPDPEGSDDIETCFAYLRAVAMTPGVQDLRSWAKVWAPWAPESDLEEIAGQRGRRKRMLGADPIAKLLFVTIAERTMLGLKTIGACDLPSEARRKLASTGKRSRDRARQEQKRRAEGRIPRTSYEAASLARLRPWEAEGMSRATWYRAQRETGPSRVEVIGKGDTPVSEQTKPQPVQRIIGQSRVAGLVEGLGDDPPAELQEAGPHGSCDSEKERAA
ncbi:hypothetical protein [Ensifer aridi]|uniref:hypothetical protein n=1 Tax=Ensifer aridi TaxID=1708715 RepID=UPI000A10C999|nr:hypothetical protein [Ensifer aridi]